MTVSKPTTKKIAPEDSCTRVAVISFIIFVCCILLLGIIVLIAYAATCSPVQGPPGPPGPACNCSTPGVTTGEYTTESSFPRAGIVATIKWAKIGSVVHFNLKPFPFPLSMDCEPLYFTGNPIAFEHLPEGDKHALSYPSYFQGGDLPTELKVSVYGTTNRMVYYPVCTKETSPKTAAVLQTSDIYFSWLSPK